MSKKRKLGKIDASRATRMLSYGSSQGKMTWVPDKSYWIRILPLHDAVLKHPFVDVPQIGCLGYPIHRGLPFKNNDGDVVSWIPYLCLDNPRDNSKCPACVYQKYMQGSGSKSDNADAKKIAREGHHMFNVYVYSEEQVYRQRLNKEFVQSLLSIADELGDITDLGEGTDIKLKVKKYKQWPLLKFVMPRREQTIFEDSNVLDAVDPVTKSLEFVKKLKRKSMCKRLVRKYGPIESHKWFREKNND